MEKYLTIKVSFEYLVIYLQDYEFKINEYQELVGMVPVCKCEDPKEVRPNILLH